jgi:CDP-diacylglycerol--glycerol-3-phosphate 3-phosphatidyltransferase/cardiolipin synthase
MNILATVVFTVASITDFVDGYIARKYNQVTDLGKILDPIADKILVNGAMILLVEMGRIGAVVVIILISRDFVIGALRNFAASKGMVIAAGMGGKVKTVIQMIGVGCLIFKNELMGIDILLIGKVLVYASVALSLYSAWIYYTNFLKAEAEKEDE